MRDSMSSHLPVSRQQLRFNSWSDASPQGRQSTLSALPVLRDPQASNIGQDQFKKELTPSRYAKLIRLHAATSASNSLYQGQDWITLTKWMSTPASPTASESYKPGFGWIYILHRDAPDDEDVEGFELSLPLLDTLNASMSSDNVIVFLRGYPNSEWIKQIGAHFRVDPEAFYRHLTFFHHPKALLRQSPFHLPSSQRSIFQLTLTTVGQYVPKPGTSLSDIRINAAKGMKKYQNDMGKSHWKLGNSIVRAFDIHSESIFSLEQLVTVYVSKEGNNGSWIALIWLDSGDDLLQSPAGPWSDLGQRGATATFPVTMYKRSISLKANHHRLIGSDTNDIHGDQGMPQSVSLLPLFYGRSLNAKRMSEDPLYALHELLLFWATSEAQFLNVVSKGLQTYVDLSPEEYHSKMADTQNSLIFYKDILDRHTDSIASVLQSIETRNLSDWPRSQASKPHLMAERIESDVRYILERSKELRERCASSMSTLTNRANLQEAKSAMAQSERVYRLTMLASVFIPLSFCASLFGMQFVTFEHTGTGIWTFIALTVPISTFSLIVFNWNTASVLSHISKARLWNKRKSLRRSVGA